MNDFATRQQGARTGRMLTATDVRCDIRRMQLARTPKAAQLAMARAAIEVGNLTNEARDVYRQFIATQVQS